MNVLNENEVQMVSGGDATDFGAAVFVGACGGFLLGGPVGAVAGAISLGGHYLVFDYLVN